MAKKNNQWRLFDMSGDKIVLGVHESKIIKGKMYFRRLK
jgi:hypothetical protein